MRSSDTAPPPVAARCVDQLLKITRLLNRRHGRYLLVTVRNVLGYIYPGADKLISGVTELLEVASDPDPNQAQLLSYFEAQSSEDAQSLISLLEHLKSDEARRTLIRVRSLTQSGASDEVIQQVLQRQIACDDSVRELFQRASRLEQSQSELVEVALQERLRGARQARQIKGLEGEVDELRSALSELITHLYALDLGGEDLAQLRDRLALRHAGVKALIRGEGEALRSLSEASGGRASRLSRLLSAGESLCERPANLTAYREALHPAREASPPSSPNVSPQPSEHTSSRLNERLHDVGRVVSSRVKGVEFKMVHCPAGEFWMGSEDGVGHGDGRPRHRVAITQPFLMGQTQVTQAQWEAIMGSNPSRFKGASLPVEQVSWFDCVRFCNALSTAEGLEPVYSIGSGDEPTVSLDLGRTGYRLPTEAEWEYAAKAGTELTYAGSNDVDEVAWYDNYYAWESHPVGQKKPNAWGLYDCSGNVFEWCSDEYNRSAYQGRTGTTRDPHEWGGSASPRVFRGGGWCSAVDCCRVAYRSRHNADNRWYYLGVRVLRCEP